MERNYCLSDMSVIGNWQFDFDSYFSDTFTDIHV